MALAGARQAAGCWAGRACTLPRPLGWTAGVLKRTRGCPPAPKCRSCSEQEIRNILWISECVAQDQKARVQDGIVYTF